MNAKIHFPVQVVFRNLSPSPSIEAKALKHAEKLGQYCNQIMSCHVIIETHHHHYKGNTYHVSIDMKVPNAELVVNRNPVENHAHEDVYVAMRDAFNAMKRKLQEYTCKRHGRVKHHIPPLEGHVLEIAPIANYGYIETQDGRRIRFTSRSVIDYDFNKLEVGDRVRFIETESIDEPAASTVYIK